MENGDGQAAVLAEIDRPNADAPCNKAETREKRISQFVEMLVRNEKLYP